MQFFRFVDDSFDISTFRKGNLPNYFFVLILIGCKVVVGDMTSSLETIREWNRLLILFQILKQIENLLVRQIIVIQCHMAIDKLDFF